MAQNKRLATLQMQDQFVPCSHQPFASSPIAALNCLAKNVNQIQLLKFYPPLLNGLGAKPKLQENVWHMWVLWVYILGLLHFTAKMCSIGLNLYFPSNFRFPSFQKELWYIAGMLRTSACGHITVKCTNKWDNRPIFSLFIVALQIRNWGQTASKL